MNEHLRFNRLPATTQAAEGLPRRRWTVADIRAMVAHGIILEDERFELVGGEVVPMSPKGARHELVKNVLEEFWFPLTVRTPVRLLSETTLYINDEEFREPDFLFWPRAKPLDEINAAAGLFIVEVADSSLRYDLREKALVYARLGLREYWVIDAASLVTSIHRNPGPNGYPPPQEAGPGELLEPLLAPQLAVRLADIGLEPTV